MPAPVISVSNLGKRYYLSHEKRTDTLRDSLTQKFRRLIGQTGPEADAEEFWALRDVSFEINRGEVVGIIGRNGAGKSTLLKILSRITEPTTGSVRLRGRVASLLEVGTGFHPELSGRENIYLNGAILGMSRAEISHKFDEIVAFAEVERFLDTQVKHYSSGMYVRLAFAVAAHLEPEILIVDEVLAVGDAAFQKKCLGKISEVSQQAGRTVLFVSHNMGIVANMCARTILLEGGRCKADGRPDEVVSSYINIGNATAGEITWGPETPAAGNARMRLLQGRVLSDGRIASEVRIDADVWLEYDFALSTHGPLDLCSSIHLFDKHGTCVLSSGPVSQPLAPGNYRHRVRLPGNFLNDGLYTVSILLIAEATRIEVHLKEALSFFVNETGKEKRSFTGTIIGCIRPKLDWLAERRPD